jgi:hypothetical protein
MPYRPHRLTVIVLPLLPPRPLEGNDPQRTLGGSSRKRRVAPLSPPRIPQRSDSRAPFANDPYAHSDLSRCRVALILSFQQPPGLHDATIVAFSPILLSHGHGHELRIYPIVFLVLLTVSLAFVVSYHIVVSPQTRGGMPNERLSNSPGLGKVRLTLPLE